MSNNNQNSSQPTGEQTPGGSEGHEDEVLDSAETPDEEDSEEPEEEEDSTEWDHERSLRKIRKANAENKRLRERAKAAEKKAASADDLESENASLRAANLRLEVAGELGIPVPLAKRLQGGTREEIMADAEDLLELVAPGGTRSRKPANQFGESHSNKSEPVKPPSLDEIAESFMSD